MRTKIRAIVFFASATLMLGLLITDVYSAWYEWTKEAREKLEWMKSTAPCVATVEFTAKYASKLGISLSELEMAFEAGLSYKNVPGTKILCANGTEFEDCREIVGGWWESWDAEGDCIPDGFNVPSDSE